MRCKKEIMGLAALMVLLFHFYIPFGQSPVETYFFRSTYIGVDLFFFVSAYSLANFKGDNRPIKFILNRLRLVYLPFVLLSAIGAIWGKWDIVRFFKVIGGVEFYERGGGAFLWYFIGIMIIYLFVPLMLWIKKKTGRWGFLILLASWAIISSILQFGLEYKKMFIYINRLPIFFLGLYFDELVLSWFNKVSKIWQSAITAALFIAGTGLVYKFGTTVRLNKPFADMYYVIAIPLAIATALIVYLITTALEGKYKSVILKFIGGITLELYGLQMIFGYNIEIALMKLIKPQNLQILAFFGTLIALTLMAFILNLGLTTARKGVNKLISKNQQKEVKS